MEFGFLAPSLRDFVTKLWSPFYPTLKGGANKLCAYGAFVRHSLYVRRLYRILYTSGAFARTFPMQSLITWLQRVTEQAENGAVRTGNRFAAIAVAVLCVSLAGIAQNQDRDNNKPFATSANAPSPEMRIDINHATANELMRVPGMTPSWAGRIVRFRPYRTKTDLVEKGVVTSEVYDRIKDYVIAHKDKQ